MAFRLKRNKKCFPSLEAFRMRLLSRKLFAIVHFLCVLREPTINKKKLFKRFGVKEETTLTQSVCA